MSRIDGLPPDQRASLSLLLRQGKRYAEVAAMLEINERVVHDRAHAALAVLAPREARALAPERREEIGDYLLGQRTGVAERLDTRSLLSSSTPARAWARAIAAELEPLTSTPLPEIPARGGSADNGVDPPTAPPPTAVPPGSVQPPPSSRTGGAVLLAVIGAIVVAVILVVVLSGGGGSQHKGAAGAGSATSTTRGATTGSNTAKATERRRIALTSPDPSSHAIGVAAVLSEGSTYAIYLAAERLPPSRGFFYAVWLYNSPTSFQALSKSPAVGSDGRLQGGALLPGNAGSYHQMILTRETSERPTRPGPIVLRGSFGLH